MVHSTFAQQGNLMMGGNGAVIRDSPSTTSPLGIPKSPSFHSGLDLMASASVDSLTTTSDSFPHPEVNSYLLNGQEPLVLALKRVEHARKGVVTKLPQLTGDIDSCHLFF